MLDEPTNDLDLATLRVLEEALVGFGGVVAVSHDRYFLNRVCTSILAFEGEGQLYYDVGNYDDYLAKRAARQAAAARWEAVAAKPASKPAPVAAAPTSAGRKLTWKEARELETIEDQIQSAEEAVTKLQDTFADPDFYQTHGERWKTMDAELADRQERGHPALHALGRVDGAASRSGGLARQRPHMDLASRRDRAWEDGRVLRDEGLGRDRSAGHVGFVDGCKRSNARRLFIAVRLGNCRAISAGHSYVNASGGGGARCVPVSTPNFANTSELS